MQSPKNWMVQATTNNCRKTAILSYLIDNTGRARYRLVLGLCTTDLMTWGGNISDEHPE